MGESLVTSTTLQLAVQKAGVNYVIEEDQPLRLYGDYHRTFRIYHGNDFIKVVVNSGEIVRIGGMKAEDINNFGFAFSGENTANTPYMLGTSGIVEEVVAEGDIYNINGELIFPTFVYDQDAGVLKSSEPCYGLVLGDVTVPYSLYGFNHEMGTEEGVYGNWYAKSLLYVFGLPSGSVATHSIPAVYPTHDSGANDKIEIWRIESRQYITDEIVDNVYERGADDPYEYLPDDYKGEEPALARMEVTVVHEIGYITTRMFGRVDLETFRITEGMNKTYPSSTNIPIEFFFPTLVLNETGSEDTMPNKIWRTVEGAIEDRRKAMAEADWGDTSNLPYYQP